MTGMRLRFEKNKKKKKHTHTLQEKLLFIIIFWGEEVEIFVQELVFLRKKIQ